MAELNLYQIIRAPHLTEKVTALKEDDNQYCFLVAAEATKGQIRQAVSALFKVDAVKVRTAMTRGKLRRMGRFQGYRSDVKKAYVRVAKGQKIDLEKI